MLNRNSSGLGFPDPEADASSIGKTLPLYVCEDLVTIHIITDLFRVDQIKKEKLLQRNLFSVYMSDDLDRPGTTLVGGEIPNNYMAFVQEQSASDLSTPDTAFTATSQSGFLSSTQVSVS